MRIDNVALTTRIELARQVLQLEQRVEAYQILYDEELAEIRSALNDCRKKLIQLLVADEEKGVSQVAPHVHTSAH